MRPREAFLFLALTAVALVIVYALSGQIAPTVKHLLSE